MKIKCGDANPKGNVMMTYKGGCRSELNIETAYRCTGCGGWFHIACIKKHFELEKKHDVGRNNLKGEILNELKAKGIARELYTLGAKGLYFKIINIIKKL